MILLRTKCQLTILAKGFGTDLEMYFELANDGSAAVSVGNGEPPVVFSADDVATLRHFLDNFVPAVE